MADNSMATMVDWSKFNRIFGGKDNMFSLPRRWSGRDYYDDLNKLLGNFKDTVKSNLTSNEFKAKLYKIIDMLLSLVRTYLHGYPAKAYSIIEELMRELETEPLYADPDTLVELYRMTEVSENVVYGRDRIFHAPYTMISKLKTYRYSIAGYPSLYLTSSLELAESESGIFETRKPAIAARFVLASNETMKEIKILELGYRPQDLAGGEENPLREKFEKAIMAADWRQKNEARKNLYSSGHSDSSYTPTTNAPERYMLWYPLIAACSYIRANRDDPFAQEYMVPQLVTQWLRSQNTDKLIGIKYFSCYSMKSSGLGENYVFPTSGDPILLPPTAKDNIAGVENYCPILNDAFLLTAPEYVPEFQNARMLTHALKPALNDKYQGCEHAFSIERDDFKGEVRIPERVTYIASNTFNNCGGLKKIHLGNSVVGIGSEVFSGCKELKSLFLTKKVESIHANTFNNCIHLETIDVSRDNKFFAAKDGVLFNKEMTLLKRYPEGKACTNGTYMISDSILEIGIGAFYNCSTLKNIQFPGKLQIIGDAAFKNCSTLDAVILHSNIKSIGSGAFADCSKLPEITLPDGLTDVNDQTFRKCTNLTVVRLPKGLKNIGDYAFADCCALPSINLPKGLKSIGDYAFLNCTQLEDVKLRKGLKSLGHSTFKGCSGLKNIKFADGPKVVGAFAFSDCSNLPEIEFHNELKHIGESAFKGCSALTKIKLPNGFESVGPFAFLDCLNLPEIEFRNGLKSIGKYAFDGCLSLKEIKLPNGLESIGDWAFSGCSSLKQIKLPEGLKSIGDRAFKGCSSLTEIELPKGLESIGAGAFYGCSNLDIINFNGDLKQWLRIHKNFVWDDGAPEFTVHFSDGTEKKKTELY